MEIRSDTTSLDVDPPMWRWDALSHEQRPRREGKHVWGLEIISTARCTDAAQALVFEVKPYGAEGVGFIGKTLHGVEIMMSAWGKTAALTTSEASLHKSQPRWFEAAVDRMTALLNLQQGWNGYDAPRISDAAVAAAMEAMLAIDSTDQLVPSIVPTHAGGVQLEWHISGIDLEADFRPEGTVGMWYSDSTTGHDREDNFPRRADAVRELDSLIAVIAARL
jgi:hypothetical protein